MGTATGDVLIVGAGLTGSTIAYELGRNGIRCVLLEREAVPGGLVRSEHMNGVLYEPHGSHIFHTDDAEVWELATELTPFRPYRHRVDIVADGQLLNWPILLSDIERQSRSAEILAQLREREGVDAAARATAANFEDWCLELMGPILYRRFIQPYTEKQWGRPARELSAEWAPRRVSVRWDNDPYLFGDAHQGWPAGANGYTDLIDGLLAPAEGVRPEIMLGVDVKLEALRALIDELGVGTVVLTCPLDLFADFALGELEWRGILVNSVYIPHLEYAQGAMVVNYPGHEFPFIRVHETKHASGQQIEGTVLGFEFTGARSRYYPVSSAHNNDLNRQYQALVESSLPSDLRVRFAGRLANYVYIDMDDCMRQALDIARDLLI